MVVIKDFTDPDCLQRRLNTRDKHLEGALINKKSNIISLGGATLDNETVKKKKLSRIIIFTLAKKNMYIIYIGW